MKKIFLILGAAIAMSLSASAQTPEEVDIVTGENVQLEMINPDQPVKETKKEKKEREKKIRKLNEDIDYAKASNSLRRGYFVLLANSVDMGGHRRTGVNETANYLLVQDNDGIIQFAFNTYSSGPNGIGGVTLKGTVRDKKIKYDDNGDVHFEYQLVSKKETAYVYITLFHNSNRAVGRVSGILDMNFNGEIRPYRDKEHR